MATSKPAEGSWPNLIARWQLSGLTQAEFCARRGLSLPTFRYHLYKPRRRSASHRPLAGTHSAAPPLFLPVVCSPASPPDRVPSPPSPIEVVLGDGLRVAVAPGFDPDTLRRVVDALGRPPC
jgi:hypothetical protein